MALSGKPSRLSIERVSPQTRIDDKTERPLRYELLEAEMGSNSGTCFKRCPAPQAQTDAIEPALLHILIGRHREQFNRILPKIPIRILHIR